MVTKIGLPSIIVAFIGSLVKPWGGTRDPIFLKQHSILRQKAVVCLLNFGGFDRYDSFTKYTPLFYDVYGSVGGHTGKTLGGTRDPIFLKKNLGLRQKPVVCPLNFGGLSRYGGLSNHTP